MPATCLTTTCFSSIDETIALTDGSTTLINNTTTGNATWVQGFELTDMPSNFSDMTTLTIDVRVQEINTRENDNITLKAQVFEDGGVTALTGLITICTWDGTTEDCGFSWNTITKTFALQGNDNKTVWDSAELNLSWVVTRTAGGDSMRVQVSTVELDGTYTATGGASPTNAQLMRHGAWFDSGVEKPFTF